MANTHMQKTIKFDLWKKHVAITQEHGSWVFLFSPLLIGLFAGRQWQSASFFLILAALAAFLFKQPLTIAVKVFSKRRPARDLPTAYFWMGVYGFFLALGFIGLWVSDQAYLSLLAIPGLPVLIWYLYLVANRAERRQIGVEIVASGVLALAAPAAFWVGKTPTTAALWWQGWELWGLVWLQSSASIVYAALRLEQRPWEAIPSIKTRIQCGQRALIYTTFNFVLVIGLGISKIMPIGLAVPFGLQWLEAVWGTFVPAAGVRPTLIGIRQLIISTLFTVLFILTWQ